MQQSEIENAITNISAIYCPLSRECQIDLGSCSTVFSLDKNAHLLKEGQYSEKIYYLIRGTARAYYLKDGKDISDWFAFENEFLCSINSFFLNSPSPHYIELLEPTTSIELSKKDFLWLCDKHHDFERLARIVVTKTMLQLQQRIVAMQFETARQKYENLLIARPDITQRVPLSHIASYLGIALETLSRIRKPKNRI
ncbi:Crp/Fnr family transcriptional regulator [Marivirga sp. S37H4]|uniref:Crp/Fnr family transcriptional regulator n=1 Tax=Marivirga aurantiaca TaxID=2802615 RepID=A0A934WYF2_9BACT|nr:Crp/Fnr family transcriptional regulator [Marivirga aurantiaca]MBK6265085.1 Crp/Fnr family transcriptional regulator [Marivirga aurantiaca]